MHNVSRSSTLILKPALLVVVVEGECELREGARQDVPPRSTTSSADATMTSLQTASSQRTNRAHSRIPVSRDGVVVGV